jgi:hypothetical protein
MSSLLAETYSRRPNLGPLRAEAQQAGDNPYAQLPGSGPKVDAFPTLGDDVVISEPLYRIKMRIDGLPDAQGNNYWLWSNSDEVSRPRTVPCPTSAAPSATRDSS